MPRWLIFYRDLPDGYITSLVSNYVALGSRIAVQLLLVPVILFYLGKEQFGVWVMIGAACNYADIGVVWLSGGASRELAKNYAAGNIERFGDAFSLIRAAYFGYALMLVAIFWLCSPWWLNATWNSNPGTKYAIIFASLYVLIRYIRVADDMVMTAQRHQKYAAWNATAEQVIFAVAVMVLLKRGEGIAGLMLAQCLGCASVLLFAWRYHKVRLINEPLMSYGWSYFRAKRCLNLYSWRLVFKKGFGYFVYGFLVLTLQMDVLWVGLLIGPEGAASWFLLFRIPEVCLLLLERIPSTFYPWAIHLETKGQWKEYARLYRKGVRIMLTLSALAALSYTLLGQSIVKAWLGNSASEVFWHYVLASAVLFFKAGTKWHIQMAYSGGRVQSLIKISAIELCLKFILFILFWKSYGYLSLAFAMCLTYACAVFWMYRKLGTDILKMSAIA
jgi:O-antigen/teichoic acid export membrane protein